MGINQQAYLERIKYNGSLIPSYDLLCKLQSQHLLNIPFENLDIHYGTTIELDIERIFEKVIYRKRGGFCYEVNGLFYELLSSLGFEVRMVSARVYNAEEQIYKHEFGHLTNIVVIDGIRYLSDVGFGDFSFHPIKIEFDNWQKDPKGVFKVDTFEDYLRVNQMKEDKEVPCSIFTDIERAFTDFKEMCVYQQTHEDSFFIKKRMITRSTKNGRITLSGNSLKIKEGEITTKMNLENETSFGEYLWEYFGMREKDL